MKEGVKITYIIKKLCNNSQVKKYLNREDIKELKKLAYKYIPDNIYSIEQIRKDVELVIDKLIKKKSYFIRFTIENFKYDLYKRAMELIDRIVKRRLAAVENEKKEC